MKRTIVLLLIQSCMLYAVLLAQDSGAVRRDTSIVMTDSVMTAVDSVAIAKDSGVVRRDTSIAITDSIMKVADSLAVVRDTVRAIPKPIRSEFRVVPNTAFAVGERLVFDLGYSFITAGEAVFSIPAIDTVSGRPTYRIEFTVNSTPTFSWIYKVEDRYQTFVDVEGLFPWKFTQRIREGGYKRDFQAEFDQRKKIATTPDGSYPIPLYVHDVVSAFYYARTFDYASMRPGQRTELKNFYNDSTYTLAVKFLGYQKISVDAGTFDCLLVEPMMTEGGLFRAEGRILIWLSNDALRIPVKVSTEVPVGSIDAELREYSGLTGPLTSKRD